MNYELSLTELIQASQKYPGKFKVQGNEYYGWWTGVAEKRQIFAALIPEEATIYVAVFDSDGKLNVIYKRPNTLKPEPKEEAPFNGSFDTDEMNEFLRALFPSFYPKTVELRPFEIPDLDLELTGLRSCHYDFIEEPTSFDKEEQHALVEWIREGCCVINFNNDYWLSSKGEVESS